MIFNYFSSALEVAEKGESPNMFRSLVGHFERGAEDQPHSCREAGCDLRVKAIQGY